MLENICTYKVKQEPSPEEDEDNVGLPLVCKQVELCPLETLSPAPPAAVPVPAPPPPPSLATLATLQVPAQGCSLLDRHRSLAPPDDGEYAPLAVKDEPTSEGEQATLSDDACSESRGPKNWRHLDMERALDALRSRSMSLTKASSTFGIPSTTLWQRAHRLGIDTPKKEGGAKSWGEGDLKRALHALRTGAISANKASKAYGIPSSTLYKIARREGIRLAAPFNAAPTAWRRPDLARALDAIRRGHSTVQTAAATYGIPTVSKVLIPGTGQALSPGSVKGSRLPGIETYTIGSPTSWRRPDLARVLDAIRRGHSTVQTVAATYGIPTGTLYGRCKREGIELSRSNPTPWSEDSMGEALEAVRVGQMSINQAAIHYNLPYSSLYGRFKRIRSVQGHQPPEPSQQPADHHDNHPQPETPGHNPPETYYQPNTAAEQPIYPYVYPQYESDYSECYYSSNGLTS